jgi:hypothetical protein
MLIELCARNYATHDKLFNGVDGVFQYVTKLQNNESLTWIGFNNPKVRFAIRIQNRYLHTTHIHETWTLIQPISKEIQVGANLSHLIMCIQCPIQPIATHTIHQSQGLILEFLTFDPNGIHHHGLIYTTLSRVREK